jgi:hypothetical protein
VGCLSPIGLLVCIAACISPHDLSSDANSPIGSGQVPLGVDISIPNEGVTHVGPGTTVTYQTNPPASGPHWPDPAELGFYDTTVPTEAWVHNLEHGHIVVLYDCGEPCAADLLDQLRQLATERSEFLVTPYDGLPEPATLAVIAWNVERFLEQFDRPALLDFYDRHVNQGRE